MIFITADFEICEHIFNISMQPRETVFYMKEHNDYKQDCYFIMNLNPHFFQPHIVID